MHGFNATIIINTIHVTAEAGSHQSRGLPNPPTPGTRKQSATRTNNGKKADDSCYIWQDSAWWLNPFHGIPRAILCHSLGTCMYTVFDVFVRGGIHDMLILQGICTYLCPDSWLGTFNHSHCYQWIPRGSRSPTFEVVRTPVDIFEQPLPRHPHWSPCSGDKSLCWTRDGEWCICSVGIHVNYQAKGILDLDGAGPHARGRRLIACGPVLSLWTHCQSNYSGVKLEDALTHMYCFM